MSNKKHIVLREGFETLFIGDGENELTESEFKTLSKYISSNLSTKFINFGYNSIKFINYVGVIVIENMIIEILPKISLTNDYSKDREMLVFMLSKCRKLSIRIDEFIGSEIIAQSLLDIIAKVFTNNLMREIQKGIYSEYVNTDQSLGLIKGKLLVSEHAKVNRFNKNKAYCQYDEFTPNNFLNAILKKATVYLLKNVRDYKLKMELNILNNQLGEISDIYIDKTKLNLYKLNARNQRFKNIFELAKMILNGRMGDNSNNNKFGFSMLFEMNYLYEEYIGIVLKEVLENENMFTSENTDILENTNINIFINVQEKSKYLLYNERAKRNEISLKPDIVVYYDDIPKVIIDTKWKSGTYNGRENYNQGDIYQMYAYVTRYKECEKCILLYPEHKDKVNVSWKLQHDETKNILMKSVSLNSYSETKEELIKILEEFTI